MKLFTIPALWAAAFFSAVVVIPFLPGVKPPAHDLVLEARIASSVSGHVRIYYDIGRGYNETDATQLTIAKTDTPQRYRFPLPRADYRSIRVDPTTERAVVVFEAPLRILGADGRVVRAVALSDLKPLHQIESIRESDGRLEVTTAGTADDPQLVVEFSPRLLLGDAFSRYAARFFSGAAGVFVSLALLLVALDRAARARAIMGQAGRWLTARPIIAIMVVAAAAVVASAYPVVFLGKSYVSPNFGTTLLYDAFPTLPGSSSPVVGDGNGSDLGAAIWQNVPYSFVERRALGRGELPLWNRYNSLGTPLLAQGQSMFGDPWHLFVLLFDGESWAWDVKYLVAKWLFATALGLLALAVVPRRPAGPPGPARTEIPLPGALIVTAAAPFVGFFLFRVNHPAIFTLCYAPWVLYGWVRIAQAQGLPSTARWLAILLVANLAVLNSGAAKEACLLLLQMNFAGALLLLAGGMPRLVTFAKLAGAAWAGALLLLITAPMWTTFLQTLPVSFTASHPVANQIQPSLLLGAFDELFFRPLTQGDLVFNPSLNFVLLLGLVYFVATLRIQLADPALRLVALCALVALAFAFGAVPPHWLTRVPLLAGVGHIDNVFLCGFIVFGSVLAAAGFTTATARLRTREGRGDLVIAALLMGVLVFAWLGFRQAAHRMVFGPGTTLTVVQYNEVIPVSPFIWASLLSLLLASVGLALIARRAFLRRSLGPAGAILAALGVVVLLWRFALHTPAMGFETYVVQPPPRARFHVKSPAIEYVRGEVAAGPARAFGVHGNLAPGWNAAYGLEGIHGPDALQNRWLRELIDASPATWGSSWRLWLGPDDTAKARPFFDALNVRYYFARAGDHGTLSPGFKLAHSSDLDVYESPTAWPRAFFTNRVQSYADPADLVNKMIASNGRPFAVLPPEALAQQSGLASLPQDGAAPSVSPATNYRLTENTTSFDIQASGPGIFVLTEAWWPDSFRVDVNGRDVPIVRVNHAFKGVVIAAPGTYRVTFSYWPKNFTRSLVLSGVGAALLALSLYLALRPVRRV